MTHSTTTVCSENFPKNGANLRETAICVPIEAHSLAGFRDWTASGAVPDHVRATFLQTKVYLHMSQEELETHVKVKTEVIRVLGNLNREQEAGELYGDGAQLADEEAELASQPDAVFVAWASLDSRRVRLVPRTRTEGQYIEIEGAADWVLEVVSNSSEEKDTARLFAAYHRAGVREYWLIDARGEEIVFHIYYWRKKGYVAATPRDGWQKSRVFGREFRLSRVSGRRGLWRYTLEMRPE